MPRCRKCGKVVDDKNPGDYSLGCAGLIAVLGLIEFIPVEVVFILIAIIAIYLMARLFYSKGLVCDECSVKSET